MLSLVRSVALCALMLPGGTMTMTWSPSRPGNWLFHCHFAFHVSPFVSLEKVPDPLDPDGPEDPVHSMHRMRGLVLGVHVRRDPSTAPTVATNTARPARRLRLAARSAPKRYGDGDGPVRFTSRSRRTTSTPWCAGRRGPNAML